MKTIGLALLTVGVCLLAEPALARNRPAVPLTAGQLARWIAQARSHRLSVERDHVAAEIRGGLLFADDKIGPAIERLRTDPPETCEASAERICEAYATVSRPFGKAWRRYVEGDYRGALEAVEPIIGRRDTTYFAAAKRFVQARALVGAEDLAEASDAYLDLVHDMPERFSFASAGLIDAGETFERMHRRYYAMMLYRLWVDTFGVLDGATAAELTARADRIEADYREPLKTVAGKMSEVRAMLAGADSGEANQQTQQEILDQLDDLIAMMEEDRDDEGVDPAPAPARQQPVSIPRPVARKPERPEPDPRARRGKPPGDSDGPWGVLPPRQRERMVASFTESIPERYRNMIRDYFARIAREQPRPAAPPKGLAPSD